jgi:DNA helicase-2/ATP-dependent DNA helicase PcrA
MPAQLEISDDDIKRVAAELGLDFANDERIAVLRCTESCEVQAGPGSGKTTLLAAKLAVLADKWPYADRGICVLSHTNAARHEVEKCLAKSPRLSRLLEYPHFIGTFQTFAHQYLALPYLRQKGVEVSAVNDEQFGRRALVAFARDNYWKARGWLNRQFSNAAQSAAMTMRENFVRGLYYADADLTVKTNGDLPGKDAGKEFIQLKERLAREGYFRYNDMYALAERAVSKRSYIPQLLRIRFPWVFVDEFQDTNASQDRLLESLFGQSECIVQYFGDKNQAIFDFGEQENEHPNLFDRKKSLLLNSTKRFGTSIATIASAFTAISQQSLQGDSTKPNRRNTIFIYDRDAVEDVVPRFANLVCQELGGLPPEKPPVCVVGSRKSEGEHTTDTFPATLSAYWPNYSHETAAESAAPDSLLGFLMQAQRQIAETHRADDATNTATDGILILLRRFPLKDAWHARSRAQFFEKLRQEDYLPEFKRLLWTALNPAITPAEATWKVWTAELLEVLKFLLPAQSSAEAAEFLAWTDILQPSSNGINNPSQSRSNIMTYQSGSDSFPIRFSTIHAVKGQTHCATLVVDTYMSRSHDLKMLLCVLTGTKHGSALDDAGKKRCTRAFVAMTRPNELLCLAIHKDNVKPAHEKALLSQKLWQVEFITRNEASRT